MKIQVPTTANSSRTSRTTSAAGLTATTTLPSERKKNLPSPQRYKSCKRTLSSKKITTRPPYRLKVSHFLIETFRNCKSVIVDSITTQSALQSDRKPAASQLADGSWYYVSKIPCSRRLVSHSSWGTNESNRVRKWDLSHLATIKLKSVNDGLSWPK